MLSAILISIQCIQSTGSGFSAGPPAPARRLYRDGVEAAARGDLELAHQKLRLASALDPWHEEARRREAELRDRLFARDHREARRLLDAGRVLAAERRFLSAARWHPGHDALRRALRNLGLQLYGEEWLHRGEITRREQDEELRAHRRSKGLGLADRFRLHRRRGLRIWTDLQDAGSRPLVRRLLLLLERQERLYRQLFAPLSPAPASGGVDVVLFRRRADYLEYGGREGTAGIFLPERVVSCFTIPPLRPDDTSSASAADDRERLLRAVFLHEVAHQLDRRVLGLSRPPRWLQEGLAVRFEAGRLDREGNLRLDAPYPASVAAAIQRSRASGWKVGELIRTDAREVLSMEGDALREYYARSWALVDYLLSGGSGSRAVFFDLVSALQDAEGSGRKAAREAGGRPDGSESVNRPEIGDAELFLRILSRHGQTMEMVETQLARYHERRGESRPAAGRRGGRSAP
ncbi:MAG: hypothetical protein O7J95_16100 [Planctomycetota bacterium]|nr:hypothetical protein [Planctomycetota bacterium]